MSENLCLHWNDFKENVNSAFGRLRDDKEFSDVILACEDGQQLEAHKVVLTTSSPFFEKIFRRNRHPHPLHNGISNDLGNSRFSKKCPKVNPYCNAIFDPILFKPFLDSAK